MFRITVEQHFDAAHSLRGYHGKCESLHGHRYRAVIKVVAAGLNEIGLSYDFIELKKQLKVITSRFDHSYLNDVPPFNQINPSAENIAKTIYDELKSSLGSEPVSLKSVTVWEAPDQGVEYRGD